MSDRPAESPSSFEELGRTRRRLLVTAMYLCLAAYAGLVSLGEARWWAMLSFGPLLVAVVIHFRYVLPVAREANKKSPSRLDERQLAIRDRAYYHAYRILGAFFVLLIIYAMLVTLSDSMRLLVPTTGAQFSGVIFASTLLVASLPASIMAWIAPDPLFSEEG